MNLGAKCKSLPVVQFYLKEISRISKSIETKNRLVVVENES